MFFVTFVPMLNSLATSLHISIIIISKGSTIKGLPSPLNNMPDGCSIFCQAIKASLMLLALNNTHPNNVRIKVTKTLTTVGIDF